MKRITFILVSCIPFIAYAPSPKKRKREDKPAATQRKLIQYFSTRLRRGAPVAPQQPVKKAKDTQGHGKPKRRRGKKKIPIDPSQVTLDQYIGVDARNRKKLLPAFEEVEEQVTEELPAVEHLPPKMQGLCHKLMGSLRNQELQATFSEEFRRRVDITTEQDIAGLINKKVDGETLLMWAVSNNEAYLVKRLLQLGAKATTTRKGKSALIEAISTGSFVMTTLLIKYGASAGSVTPLLLAARNGHVRLCKLLLAHSQNVNAANRWGYTGLIYAARCGNAPLCKLFLDKGASVTKKSNRGFSPLMFACKSGSVETCQLLIKQGALVNDMSTDGISSPLLVAAAQGSLPVVDLLLRAGANPFHRASNGMSPTLLAARLDNIFLANRMVVGLFDYCLQKVYGLLLSLRTRAQEWQAPVGSVIEEQAPHLLYKHREILLKEPIRDAFFRELAQHLSCCDSSGMSAYDYLKLSQFNPACVQQTARRIARLMRNRMVASQQLDSQQRFLVRNGQLLLG